MEDSLAMVVLEVDAGPERRSDPLWLPGIKYLMLSASASKSMMMLFGPEPPTIAI